MSQNIALCTLCNKPMSTSGDHQICSLRCGHLFGYSCISKYFNSRALCPMCQAPIHLRDIQLLFWEDALGLDQSLNEQIGQKNSQLEDEILGLERQIQTLENNVMKVTKKISDSLKQGELIGMHEVKEVESVSRPALICEKKISYGLRLESCLNHIFVSTMHTNESDNSHVFGLEYASYYNLGNFSFIPLHSEQMRDIASNEEAKKIATSSIDKSISVISIDTMEVENKFLYLQPIWTCSWKDENVIYGGSERGQFFGIDWRSGTLIFQKEMNGPPVNSINPISNDVVLITTARDLYLYDIVASQKIPIIPKGKFQVPLSALSLKNCKNSNAYIYITKSSDSFYCGLSTFDLQGYFSIASLEIPKIAPVSRAAGLNYNDTLYISYPYQMNMINTFSLRKSTNLRNDLWAVWQNHWFDYSHPSNIVDLCFDTVPNPVLSSLSQNMLRIYELPL